jgi:hypothetical protein
MAALAGLPGMQGSLTGSSRVKLRELRITMNDGSFTVGDLAHGEFIEVPEIGVRCTQDRRCLGTGCCSRRPSRR